MALAGLPDQFKSLGGVAQGFAGISPGSTDPFFEGFGRLILWCFF
jgi:hypothetical protein